MLWFPNTCSKVFRIYYEGALFLCTIFVRKCRVKKNVIFFVTMAGGIVATLNQGESFHFFATSEE